MNIWFSLNPVNFLNSCADVSLSGGSLLHGVIITYIFGFELIKIKIKLGMLIIFSTEITFDELFFFNDSRCNK
jgi:hypothetical protein